MKFVHITLHDIHFIDDSFQAVVKMSYCIKEDLRKVTGKQIRLYWAIKWALFTLLTNNARSKVMLLWVLSHNVHWQKAIIKTNSSPMHLPKFPLALPQLFWMVLDEQK